MEAWRKKSKIESERKSKETRGRIRALRQISECSSLLM